MDLAGYENICFSPIIYAGLLFCYRILSEFKLMVKSGSVCLVHFPLFGS